MYNLRLRNELSLEDVHKFDHQKVDGHYHLIQDQTVIYFILI